MRENNIKMLKKYAIDYLNIKLPFENNVKSNDQIEDFFVQHPYTNAIVTILPGSDDIVYLNNKESINKWRHYMKERIDKAKDINDILMLMNKPYKLDYLFTVYEYLSPNELANTLKSVWQAQEYIISKYSYKEVELLFKLAKCDSLIENKLKFKNNKIRVYRGVSDTNYDDPSVSWTTSLDVAKFFATRFNSNGIIYSLEVSKKDILASFEYENEVIININDNLWEQKKKIDYYKEKHRIKYNLEYEL